MLSAFAAIALLQTPQAPPPAQQPKYEMKTYQFVMLKKGAPVALTAAEQEKRQTAHIEYLEKLWLKDKKAVLLGPFTDDGEIRGIVVLNTSAEEAKQLMDADPWVSTGAMKADIRPLLAADKILGTPPKFMDLVGCTIGFYKRPPGDLPKLSEDEAKTLQAAHMANNNKMAEAGALVWAGPFLDGTNLRGLLVFRITDQEKIKALIAEDMLVKAGRLVAELHPAMTAKGALPEPKKP